MREKVTARLHDLVERRLKVQAAVNVLLRHLAKQPNRKATPKEVLLLKQLDSLDRAIASAFELGAKAIAVSEAHSVAPHLGNVEYR